MIRAENNDYIANLKPGSLIFIEWRHKKRLILVLNLKKIAWKQKTQFSVFNFEPDCPPWPGLTEGPYISVDTNNTVEYYIP